MKDADDICLRTSKIWWAERRGAERENMLRYNWKWEMRDNKKFGTIRWRKRGYDIWEEMRSDKTWWVMRYDKICREIIRYKRWWKKSCDERWWEMTRGRQRDERWWQMSEIVWRRREDAVSN